MTRPLTLLVLVAAVTMAVRYAADPPAPEPATAPATAFSAERAMAHIREIARAPRPAGSAEHARVRQYILDELDELGLQPHVQETLAAGTRHPVAGQVRNVLVRIPGSEPDGRAALLMSHYDGVGGGPAAADAASGSAVLLETLRALIAGGRLRHDVIALFTDAEEDGLLGAAAFVADHPWARKVGVVLNFEARGVNGRSQMFETGPGNLQVVRALARVPGVAATSLSTEVYRRLPNDTDLSEFAPLKLPAMNFAFIGGVERYHTAQDAVEHLDPGSVQHHGRYALALTRIFAGGEMPAPGREDAIFFDLPVLGLIVYPASFALPIAILTLAMLGAAALLRRRADRGWLRALGLGAVGLLASLLLSVVAALLLVGLAGWMHARLSTSPAPSAGEYAVMVSLGAATAAVLCLMAARGAAFRSSGAGALGGVQLGAMLLLGVVSMGLALTVSGATYLLAWPLFLAALAAVAGQLDRRAGLAAGAIAIVGTVFVLVPTAHGVVQALGFESGAGTVAALTTVGTWLLAPALDHGLAESRGRGAALLGGAAVVVLLAAVTGTAARPRPAVAGLTYLLDADSMRASLVGSGVTPRGRSWVQAARREQAPLAALEPPRVEPAGGEDGWQRWRIVPAPGTREIAMSASPGVVAEAMVDGRPVDRSRYRRRGAGWQLRYVAPADSGFILSVRWGESPDRAIVFEAMHSGLPALDGIPARPDDVLQGQSGDATAVRRVVRTP